MTKPITLVSVSMTESFRQSLRRQGYEEINPNLFIFSRDGGRVIWKYTGNAWTLTTEEVDGS